jgi:hypothetical protein
MMIYPSCCPCVQDEFDTAKQNKYKTAVASAAGTIAANIEILTIIEGQFRRAGSVTFKTKVRLRVCKRENTRLWR